MNSKPLPLGVKLGYGICDLGGNLFFTVIAFLLLNYLTDTVGIAPGLAGLIIMIGKLWDAVTDPVAGFVSDRTQTRWGRRRPFILFGSIPLFLTMMLMFFNPGLSGQGVLFTWGVVCFCLLCTAYTLVNIPYSALTPELTQDYHERTALNGYRFGFAVIGTLLGAGAALPLVNAFGDKTTGYLAMGTLFGLVMMVTALVTFFSVQEPEASYQGPQPGFIPTYAAVFQNRPYVWILLTYALHVTALTIVSGIAIYYFKYIHHDESQTTVAMLILLATAMAFIPVSVILSRKLGKKRVYAFGMAIFALAIMILFFLGHERTVSFSFLIMGLAGLGMGFTYAIPYAMVPDAIDYDVLKTRVRREGAFYGIWTFGFKIGQALALGITGAVLSATGYVPDALQSQGALLGIRLLLGPIPAAIFLLALVALCLYPINEQRYKEILAGIKAMENRREQR